MANASEQNQQLVEPKSGANEGDEEAKRLSQTSQQSKASLLSIGQYSNWEKAAVCISKLRLPFIFDVPLRSFGQVIFCDSDISGAIFLAALFVGDPWLAVLAIVGCYAGCATGYLAGFDDVFVKMGLSGYNGVLVGCAFAVFLNDTPWSWEPVVATIVGGSVSAFITVSSANMSNVPAWTFPFNYVVLGTLMCTNPFANPEPIDIGMVGMSNVTSIVTVSATPSFNDYPTEDILKAILVGISQIFVVNNWMSGILVIIGMAIHDLRLSICVVIGSALGLCTALAVNAPGDAIVMGLWGYNPALTGAVVCVFFQHTWQVLGLLVWSCVATQVLSAGFAKAAGQAFNIPICTIPFSLMATFVFMLRNHIKGYETPHTIIAKKRGTIVTTTKEDEKGDKDAACDDDAQSWQSSHPSQSGDSDGAEDLEEQKKAAQKKKEVAAKPNPSGRRPSLVEAIGVVASPEEIEEERRRQLSKARRPSLVETLGFN